MRYYVDRMCDFPNLENMNCYTISKNRFKYESNLFTYTGYTLLNNFNSTNPTSSNWNRYYNYDINGNVSYDYDTTNYKFIYYPNYRKNEYNYTYGLSLDYNGSSYINKYAPAYIVTKYGDKFAYANFLWTTVQIVPDYDKLSYHGDISESSGFYFTCPKDNVILYRWHSGNENGSTKYAYAPLKLKAIYKSDYPILYGTYTADIVPKNYSIHIDSTYWTGEMKESETYGPTKGLQVQNGWAWTGRYHYKDENDATKYQVGRIVLTINGKTIYAPTNVHTTKYYDDRKESRGNWDKWFHPKDTFIISRQHKGDENETTWYTYSYYRVNV